jgi:hypothetical protein
MGAPFRVRLWLVASGPPASQGAARRPVPVPTAPFRVAVEDASTTPALVRTHPSLTQAARTRTLSRTTTVRVTALAITCPARTLTNVFVIGAAGYTPRNYVDYTCGNTAVTLTLCPGSSSHY